MLQQTQVERVVPRWRRWLERWPTVAALAAATPAEVIVEWQGLGYNRRAVNLHRAARAVVARRAGRDDLDRAARVSGPTPPPRSANFAFGRDVLPVDTNVRRVQERTGESFDGSCAQALFDLGATICLARVPRCGACPLAAACPVAREPVRAAAEAVAVRRVVPAAARALALEPSPPGRAAADGEAVESLERDGLVTVGADGRAALPDC